MALELASVGVEDAVASVGFENVALRRGMRKPWLTAVTIFVGILFIFCFF